MDWCTALLDQAAAGTSGHADILDRVQARWYPSKPPVGLVAVAFEVKRRVEADKGDAHVDRLVRPWSTLASAHFDGATMPIA